MTNSIAPSPLDRAVLRERERKQRQRRKARLDAMRTTANVLERAVLIVLTLHDHDDHVEWDGFLDADAVRARQLMRQSLAITKEAQSLQTTQYQLQRLLREHRLASLVLSGLLGAEPVDEWEADLQRWKQLTRKHFKPWTLWDCADEIDIALHEINAMLFHPDSQTTGVSFLGWRDRRVLDPVTRSLQFLFFKEYHGFDMQEFFHGMWALFLSAELYKSTIMGNVKHSSAQIIQDVSPTTCITRSDERHATVDVHSLCLLFRVKTDTNGFIQCVRSIPAPELQAAIQGPNDMWATINVWFKWEPLSDDSQSFRFLAGGYFGGTDSTYANRWFVETLVALVRAESRIVRRPLLKATE